MKIKILFSQLLLVFSLQLSAQWNKVENLPSSDFTTINNINNIIYTATGNTLYFSGDAGATWQNASFTSATTEVRTIVTFGSRLYLGTATGIYSAPIGNLNGQWTHHLNSGWVSSFAAREGTLFASTMGGGVYIRNASGNWINCSNGLPSYSLSVYKLLDTPQGMLAFAGSNGTFYKFWEEANTWTEHYYNGVGYNPGLDFEDAQRVGSTMYVSRYNKVLKSEDFGNSWLPDQTGLTNGLNRTMAVGSEYFYVLTTTATDSGHFTFLSKRDLTATGSWDSSELLDFYSYALAELGEKTFIASNQGVYLNDASLGTNAPENHEGHAVIYPNPSPDGIFFVQSDTPMTDLAVYDASGKILFLRTNSNHCDPFKVPRDGIYLAKLMNGNTVQTIKIIAQSR